MARWLRVGHISEIFIKSKQERLRNQQYDYEAQQQYHQHVQIFIDRFHYNANRASQVQRNFKMLKTTQAEVNGQRIRGCDEVSRWV